jgi:hypothetical protein
VSIEDGVAGSGGWTDEQAFASVHDLVHYAIVSEASRW